MNLFDALNLNGKVRLNSWKDHCFIAYSQNIKAFIDENGMIFNISSEGIISEGWEPFTEPCKHEPASSLFEGIKYTGSKPASSYKPVFMFLCRHCNKSIKSTGWVTDDTP